MTVYNKASLVLAESPAYKAGKIQPYYPLTPDVSFDFTRATSATRVNASGNIEKETQNLLLQSNQFDTTWTSTSGVSVTDGQSGYDGTNDAWLLARTSTGGERLAQAISQSGVQTYSVYAKANVGDWLYMRCNTSGSPATAWVDLANGVFGSTSNLIDSKIESVGNGWYRCSMAFNSTTVEARLYSVDGNGSVVGTNESIYIQDAQLEQGLVASDYQETTTAVFYGGITDNIPRLDYTDSSCPSVLLEPQRTNLVTQSEYFDDWTTTEVTLTPNNGTSPEGVSNAYSIIETTANNRHRIYKSIAKSASAIDYCFSVFVKNKSGSRNVRLNLESNIAGSKASVVFDTSGNVVSTASAIGSFTEAESFKEQVGDYWKYTLKAKSDTGTTLIPIFLINNGTTEVYTGDGTSGIYLFGAQVEEGSYATSYIPTYGTSVTRNTDDLDRLTNLSTNGIANNYSTTLFFEGTNFKTTANTRFVTLYNSSASSNPRVLLFSSNSNSSVFYMNLQYRATGQTDANVASGNMSYNTKFKAIMRLDGTSLSLFLDGTKYSTTIVQADDIEVLDLADVAADLSHTMSELAIFPTALTDDECIALTTL